MKNKNSISAFLFISLIINILLPLLGRGPEGEAFAQQLLPINIKRPSEIKYADSTRQFEPIISINNNGEMMGIAHSQTEAPFTKTPHLYKLDSTGKYLWLKNYNFASTYKREEFGALILNQNNLYIFGRTQDEPSGYANSYNAFIIKTDTAGNLLWKSKWGEDARAEGATAITTCSDGGVAFCAYTETGSFTYDSLGKGYTPAKSLVIKYNANGTVKFNKAFQIPLTSIDPGGVHCYFKAIVETPDKGYLIVADGAPSHYGNYGSMKPTGLFLLKIDSLGNKLWDKAVMYDYNLQFAKGINISSMIPHPSGGYVMVGIGNIMEWENDPTQIIRDSSCGQVYIINGVRHYYNIDKVGALMMKITEEGSVEWIKTYHGDPQIPYGRRCEDIKFRYYPAGYTFANITLTTSTVSSQGFIISGERSGQLIVKTDLKGNILWSREYGNIGGGLKIYEETGGSLIVNALKPGDVGILRLNHRGYLQDTTCSLKPKILVYEDDTLYSFVSNISYSTTPTNIMSLAAITVSGNRLPTITNGDCYNSILAGFVLYPNECDVNSDGSTVYVNTVRSCIGAAWYRWDYGDPASGIKNFSDSAYGYHFYQTPGTYTITLTIWDNDSTHTDSFSKEIEVAARRNISILPKDTSICQWNSVDLKAIINNGSFPNYGFELTGGDTIANYRSLETDSTFHSIPLPKSLRFYIKTYGNTCVVSDTATVNVLPNVDLKIQGDSIFCSGDNILLIASGSSTYLWNPGGSTNDSLMVFAGDTYFVSSGQTETCGTGADTASINVSETMISVVAGDDQTIDVNGQSVQLLADGGISYLWSPALGLNSITIANPMAKPSQTTTYSVTATDANGCIGFDTVTVYLNNCNADVFIPNAFSPNADNINDQVIVRGNDCIQTYNLRIYDRWGEKVFESNNMNTVWDGTYKNKKLNNGVFVYYLEVITKNGETISQKGNISLIR